VLASVSCSVKAPVPLEDELLLDEDELDEELEDELLLEDELVDDELLEELLPVMPDEAPEPPQLTSEKESNNIAKENTAECCRERYFFSCIIEFAF
jgi:hypothetical protein